MATCHVAFAGLFRRRLARTWQLVVKSVVIGLVLSSSGVDLSKPARSEAVGRWARALFRRRTHWTAVWRARFGADAGDGIVQPHSTGEGQYPPYFVHFCAPLSAGHLLYAAMLWPRSDLRFACSSPSYPAHKTSEKAASEWRGLMFAWATSGGGIGLVASRK